MLPIGVMQFGCDNIVPRMVMDTLHLASTPSSLIAPLPICKHRSIDSMSMSKKCISALFYSPQSSALIPIAVKGEYLNIFGYSNICLRILDIRIQISMI